VFSKILSKAIRLVPWQLRTWIKKTPIIAPLQRYLIARFLAGKDFVHQIDAGPARGLNYPVRLPDDKSVWTGTYELDFAEALARAVKPGAVCFDIGGYRGFFSGVCALAGASAVHIFEPLPANRKRIEALMNLNPDLPITLHPMAVGNKTGAAAFAVMAEKSMGKLSNSAFQTQRRSEEVIEIPVETLDHLMATGVVATPSLIKIDVEGAEIMVLTGGEGLLRDVRPQLFIEIHSRELARECFSLLRDYGYSVRVLETKEAPDFRSEPEVCHFIALDRARSRF
jgi:FkbM family methyltransferase